MLTSGIYGNPPKRITRKRVRKVKSRKRRNWVYGHGKTWRGERSDEGLLVLPQDHCISGGYSRSGYKH